MDNVFLALRVVVSLAVVIAAIWFVQKRVGRGGKGKSKSKPISVVARQSVGAKATVAVVEFGGKRFLLGVTEHAVSVLDSAEMPAEEAIAEQVEAVSEIESAADQPAAAARDFASVLTEAEGLTEAAALADANSVPATPLKTALVKAVTTREPALIKPNGSRLAGSVLSASTWKQAFTALRGER